MSEAHYSSNVEQGVTSLYLSGDWCIGLAVPDFAGDELVKSDNQTQLSLIGDELGEWDSMLMLFVMQCHRWCNLNSMTLDVQRMPFAVGKLLSVATAVTVYEPPQDTAADKRRLLARIEQNKTLITLKEFLEFTGSFSKTLVKYLRGNANTRAVDILYFIEQVGPKALGIITLISVLLGMILAYLGSVQLRQLGAQVYVADLVSIGMTREMGALMTGVILAGRTGAAYAAQLGTMQVNQEIDALKVMAMSSMEFLVLPRMLALIFIMPLLVLYSDVLGMLGGAVVATGMDVSWMQYITQTKDSVDMVDILCGLIKSLFFAILIGIAGCQAGLKCGRDSTAVGHAATSAVVRAIVYLICADAALNILYDKMGI